MVVNARLAVHSSYDEFHATGVTNQGSRVAQPPHVKIATSNVLLVKSTVSAAKKRIRTHKCITTLPPAFHRHLPVAKKALETVCKWWVRSQVVLPAFPTPIMHSSHLCPPDPFFTYNLTIWYSSVSRTSAILFLQIFQWENCFARITCKKLIYHLRTLNPRVSAYHLAGQYHTVYVQHRASIFP